MKSIRVEMKQFLISDWKSGKEIKGIETKQISEGEGYWFEINGKQLTDGDWIIFVDDNFINIISNKEFNHYFIFSK